MRAGIRISSLVPSGLVIESVSDSSDSIIIAVRAESGVAECPLCGARSSRIHSRYDRQAADLPCVGKEIRLRVITRRFVCEVPHCRRRIFAERFGDDVLQSRSRRTARLDCIVHHLGLVLGGRPAASFAKRLMLPVSNDTLLRVVRRRTALRTDPLTVVGIDDWAFRRNRRYGTIVCDLERRRIVTLLPDREVATVRAWLADHPGINIVSRDRGGGYGEAVAKALPDAIQVADRWHLMENASAAFLDAVRKSMRAIRSATVTPTIIPELLTSAEKLRYESYLRREDTTALPARFEVRAPGSLQFGFAHGYRLAGEAAAGRPLVFLHGQPTAEDYRRPSNRRLPRTDPDFRTPIQPVAQPSDYCRVGRSGNRVREPATCRRGRQHRAQLSARDLSGACGTSRDMLRNLARYYEEAGCRIVDKSGLNLCSNAGPKPLNRRIEGRQAILSFGPVAARIYPAPPRGQRRTAWGRCGSLLLHCDGLAPSTRCRSPGALSAVYLAALC